MQIICGWNVGNIHTKKMENIYFALTAFFTRRWTQHRLSTPPTPALSDYTARKKNKKAAAAVEMKK